MAAPDTGQENATTIKLTQEDVEKIKSLPKRTFLIGNLQQTGLYDEKTRRFYYLDANGEWNGRLAIINTPPPPPPSPDEEEPEDEGPSEEESVDDSSDGGDAPTSLADKAKGLFSFLKKKGDGAESPYHGETPHPHIKKIAADMDACGGYRNHSPFVDGLRHYTRCKPRLCTTGCTASKQYRSHTTVWKPARHRGRKPADK